MSYTKINTSTLQSIIYIKLCRLTFFVGSTGLRVGLLVGSGVTTGKGSVVGAGGRVGDLDPVHLPAFPMDVFDFPLLLLDPFAFLDALVEG